MAKNHHIEAADFNQLEKNPANSLQDDSHHCLWERHPNDIPCPSSLPFFHIKNIQASSSQPPPHLPCSTSDNAAQ